MASIVVAKRVIWELVIRNWDVERRRRKQERRRNQENNSYPYLTNFRVVNNENW
ncbi:hypothetical protein [Microcoleus vaginatus]|uniref:hypothetical protein n=1 Tax=Microcoleus vaginatus TaxID=119532 RepID=UPI00403F2A5D